MRAELAALEGFEVGQGGRTLYLCPRAIDGGTMPEAARPLAGGPLHFGMVEVICRTSQIAGPSRIDRAVWGVTDLLSVLDRLPDPTAETVRTLLGRLSASRDPFAGLAMDRPHVMGVVNVTPDSFSDGGDHPTGPLALALARRMAAEGATILDVGGESTRPGAEPVPLAGELGRVLPVIEGLVEARRTDAGPHAYISIDTRHAAVMTAACEAGADIINDVTALAGDPDSLSAAAATGVPVMLMHMQGTPETMQQEPHYDSAPLDVFDYLADRVAACEAVGIPRNRIVVDPGIGFGKTLAHNMELLEYLALFHGLGCPLLLGASRKSFVARLSRGEAPKQRLPGSLAAALAGLDRGVQIVRVHDVGETLQAIRVWRAIRGLPDPEGTGVPLAGAAE